MLVPSHRAGLSRLAVSVILDCSSARTKATERVGTRCKIKSGAHPGGMGVMESLGSHDGPRVRKTVKLSTYAQCKLVLWKILTSKRRDSSSVFRQVLFPALFLVAIWLILVMGGVTHFVTGWVWNKSNTNYERKDGDTRNYQKGQILSHGLLELFTSQFMFIPFMQVVLVSVVVEQHAKLVEAMKMAGLTRVSYWLANLVAESLVACVAAMLIAVVSAPGLFNHAGWSVFPFGEIFGLMWVYLVALTAFCFAAAAVIPSALIASIFSVVVQVATDIMYLVLLLKASNSDRGLGSGLRTSPETQRAWAVIPQFAYSLIVESFLSNRARSCRILASTDGATFVGEKYECNYEGDDDEYGITVDDASIKAQRELYSWFDSTGFLCCRNDDDISSCCDRPGVSCSDQGPDSEFYSFYSDDSPRSSWTGALYGMLFLDICMYLVLAWYFNQVVPWAEYGSPKPWYFPFVPSFWCRRTKKPSELADDDLSMMASPLWESNRGRPATTSWLTFAI